MIMKLKLYNTINLSHHLVNGISLINNNMYYVSGASNSIIKYDLESGKESLVSGGVCGYGMNKFREPVHVFASEIHGRTQLLVSDWHNHRVVKLSDAKYEDELGCYSSRNSLLFSLSVFVGRLSNPGTYIASHFGESNKEFRIKTSFISNIIYFITSFFRLRSKRFYPFNKPNGICSFNKGYLVTQKNRNCLTFISSDFQTARDIDIPNTGRIGNINTSSGKTIFCVESIGKIYEIREDEEISEIKVSCEDNSLKPFSAIYLEESLLGVIAKSKFYIFDIALGKQLAVYETNGELHGMDISDHKVYLSDRLNSQIYVLEYVK